MSEPTLQAVLAQRGLSLVSYGGCQTVARYGEVADEWRALDAGVALLDLSHRRTIIATGSERIQFLQGQLSNDISGLEPGGGLAALALNAQGRVQAILSVYEYGERTELVVEQEMLDPSCARLEQFLVADDVVFESAPRRDRIGLGGPAVARILREAGLECEAADGVWSSGQGTLAGSRVQLASRGDLRVPLVEISVEGDATDVWRHLEGRGALPAGAEALEIVRVESGTPRYGIDVDDGRIAVEARLEWAIHFSKGCYVGQEVIERAVSRGRINRRLCLLSVEHGARVGDRVVGGSDKDLLTTVVDSPRLGSICLAYLPYQATAAGTEVEVKGQAGLLAARVLEWPRKEELAGR